MAELFHHAENYTFPHTVLPMHKICPSDSWARKQVSSCLYSFQSFYDVTS